MKSATLGERISTPGEYRGFGSARFDGWLRRSEYVTARDGTRLAVDILIPTKGDMPASEPLPVVWTATQYQRAFMREGKVVTIAEEETVLQTFLRHGYVIVALDMRGTGASFGVKHGILTPNDPLLRWDLYDVACWIGKQAWCDGNIGMFGISFVASTQYATAMTCPPHVKCIVPEQAVAGMRRGMMNLNGLQNIAFRHRVDVRMRDLNIDNPAPPVDEDHDGSLLAEAVEQHRQQIPSLPSLQGLDHTNSWSPVNQNVPGMMGLATEWPLVGASGIAIYHWGGWDDLFPDETWKLYRMFDRTNPSRVVVGPWYHTEENQHFEPDFDYGIELLRWYDRWLKGIDNGIDREDPILYFVQDAGPGQAWRSAAEWPLPGTRMRPLFLARGPSGTIGSLNDGVLADERPADDDAGDALTVDPELTTKGLSTRYNFGAPGDDFQSIARHEGRYTDASPFEAAVLTWTSAPLPDDVEVTGHPVAHILLRSRSSDADLFLVLSEVSPDGRSRWVCEGMIRGSNRALGNAPRENLGLPYHPGFSHLQAPLPTDGTVVPLDFELLPTSKVFRRGHRMRICIYGSDKGNWMPLDLPDPVQFEIMPGSFVDIPVVN